MNRVYVIINEGKPQVYTSKRLASKDGTKLGVPVVPVNVIKQTHPKGAPF